MHIRGALTFDIVALRTTTRHGQAARCAGALLALVGCGSSDPTPTAVGNVTSTAGSAAVSGTVSAGNVAKAGTGASAAGMGVSGASAAGTASAAGSGRGSAGAAGSAAGTAGAAGGDFGFAATVQPFINQACNCHQSTPALMAPFSLKVGEAYEQLVGVPAQQLPGMSRVKPGSLQDSYLWHKIEGTQAQVGGSGTIMPSNIPLNATEKLIFQRWIEAGAPR